MNIKLRALNICPASGTDASSFFAAKEQPNTLFKMIVSTHEEWLQTIVGTCSGSYVCVLYSGPRYSV
jgi:hypothetical protein